MKIQVILFIALITFFLLVDSSIAYSQIPPLPPPPNSFSEEGDEEFDISSSDAEPPEINFKFSQLKDGTNMISFEIIDESEVIRGRISYVHEGRIVETDLAKERENLFVALIEASPPSSVIIVEATDIANNTARVTQVFDVVHEDFNIFIYIYSWFEGLFSRFV